MKFSNKVLLIALFLFVSLHAFSQNVMINVLTQNSGIVKKDETIFFEVSISNTSSISQIPPYKLRPQISFPNTLVAIPDTGHILPKGWAILSNSIGVVVLTNGSDIIGENENRTILIALKGKAVGGPSTVMGSLTFSNGIAPGMQTGSSLKGDNIADNSSTSSVIIIE